MSKIVAVHSFRGGTGKSNITANLATTMAFRGHRVGVVDCDIQSPGIHVIFGLDPKDVKKSLNDFLWHEAPIEEAAYDVMKPMRGSGDDLSSGALYLVPSSLDARDIARVLREGYDVDLLNDGLRQLIDHFKLDYLFIDTHPGLNEEILLSIAVSDILVIIMRPDRQDFQGTAVTVEVARKLEVPRMFIVVNMALSSLDFVALKGEVEGTYGAVCAGILPLSEDVVRLASEGVFCLKAPEHVWSQTVAQIGARLEA